VVGGGGGGGGGSGGSSGGGGGGTTETIKLSTTSVYNPYAKSPLQGMLESFSKESGAVTG
jgi:hypothetical protein